MHIPKDIKSLFRSYLPFRILTAMSKSLTVALVGATGTTGSAIVTGLLSSSETIFVGSIHCIVIEQNTSFF